MNGDVTVKTKDGGMIVRIPYTTIQKVKLPHAPEDSTKEVGTHQKGQEKYPAKPRPYKK
jgi:hypothetical protein